MKLLLDMNLSPRWGVLLAAAGLDSVHWSLLGAPDATDAEIMMFAAANDYVVLTHDLDFSAILATLRGTRPSVAQIRAEDVSTETIGKEVVAALLQMKTELETGAIVTIEPGRARARVLPIGSGR